MHGGRQRDFVRQLRAQAIVARRIHEGCPAATSSSGRARARSAGTTENAPTGMAASSPQRASSDRQIASVPKLPMRLSCMISSMRVACPSAAQRVGGVGQPVFMKAAGDHDQVDEHRQRGQRRRQMRAQQALDADRSQRDQRSHQGIKLCAASSTRSGS